MDFFHLKIVRVVLIVLACLVVLLLVFGLGMMTGYRRALFASEWGANYYHNFYGGPMQGPPGPAGMFMMGPGPGPEGHGTVGTVIDITSSTLSVRDPGNNEASVAVMHDTVIREGGETVSVSDIKDGDRIAVIGMPGADGQIQARFIRVFAASSSVEQQ